MKDLIQDYKEIKKENPNCASLNNFIAFNLVNYHSIEEVFLPVFIDGQKVQFTNINFHELSSGDEYYLIIVGDKYKFLKYGYEPDCDGGYYFHYIVDLFDTRSKEYEMYSNLYSKNIFEILKHY